MESSAGGSIQKATRKRPLNYWSPLNEWWRRTYEQQGFRPKVEQVIEWYHGNAASVWPGTAPAVDLCVEHAKCLRSKQELLDYAARTRARKAGLASFDLRKPDDKAAYVRGGGKQKLAAVQRQRQQEQREGSASPDDESNPNSSPKPGSNSGSKGADDTLSRPRAASDGTDYVPELDVIAGEPTDMPPLSTVASLPMETTAPQQAPPHAASYAQAGFAASLAEENAACSTAAFAAPAAFVAAATPFRGAASTTCAQPAAPTPTPRPLPFMDQEMDFDTLDPMDVELMAADVKHAMAQQQLLHQQQQWQEQMLLASGGSIDRAAPAPLPAHQLQPPQRTQPVPPPPLLLPTRSSAQAWSGGGCLSAGGMAAPPGSTVQGVQVTTGMMPLPTTRRYASFTAPGSATPSMSYAGELESPHSAPAATCSGGGMALPLAHHGQLGSGGGGARYASFGGAPMRTWTGPRYTQVPPHQRAFQPLPQHWRSWSDGAPAFDGGYAPYPYPTPSAGYVSQRAHPHLHPHPHSSQYAAAVPAPAVSEHRSEGGSMSESSGPYTLESEGAGYGSMPVHTGREAPAAGGATGGVAVPELVSCGSSHRPLDQFAEMADDHTRLAGPAWSGWPAERQQQQQQQWQELGHREAQARGQHQRLLRQQQHQQRVALQAQPALHGRQQPRYAMPPGAAAELYYGDGVPEAPRMYPHPRARTFVPGGLPLPPMSSVPMHAAYCEDEEEEEARFGRLAAMATAQRAVPASQAGRMAASMAPALAPRRAALSEPAADTGSDFALEHGARWYSSHAASAGSLGGFASGGAGAAPGGGSGGACEELVTLPSGFALQRSEGLGMLLSAWQC